MSGTCDPPFVEFSISFCRFEFFYVNRADVVERVRRFADRLLRGIFQLLSDCASKTSNLRGPPRPSKTRLPSSDRTYSALDSCKSFNHGCLRP